MRNGSWQRMRSKQFLFVGYEVDGDYSLSRVFARSPTRFIAALGASGSSAAAWRRNEPDEAESPGMRMLLPIGRSGWAIASGYLGLISIMMIPAPLAVFTGIMAIREIKRNPKKHGMGRTRLRHRDGSARNNRARLFGIAMLSEEAPRRTLIASCAAQTRRRAFPKRTHRDCRQRRVSAADARGVLFKRAGGP